MRRLLLRLWLFTRCPKDIFMSAYGLYPCGRRRGHPGNCHSDDLIDEMLSDW